MQSIIFCLSVFFALGACRRGALPPGKRITAQELLKAILTPDTIDECGTSNENFVLFSDVYFITHHFRLYCYGEYRVIPIRVAKNYDERITRFTVKGPFHNNKGAFHSGGGFTEPPSLTVDEKEPVKTYNIIIDGSDYYSGNDVINLEKGDRSSLTYEENILERLKKRLDEISRLFWYYCNIAEDADTHTVKFDVKNRFGITVAPKFQCSNTTVELNGPDVDLLYLFEEWPLTYDWAEYDFDYPPSRNDPKKWIFKQYKKKQGGDFKLPDVKNILFPLQELKPDLNYLWQNSQVKPSSGVRSFFRIGDESVKAVLALKDTALVSLGTTSTTHGAEEKRMMKITRELYYSNLELSDLRVYFSDNGFLDKNGSPITEEAEKLYVKGQLPIKRKKGALRLQYADLKDVVDILQVIPEDSVLEKEKIDSDFVDIYLKNYWRFALQTVYSKKSRAFLIPNLVVYRAIPNDGTVFASRHEYKFAVFHQETGDFSTEDGMLKDAFAIRLKPYFKPENEFTVSSYVVKNKEDDWAYDIVVPKIQ